MNVGQQKLTDWLVKRRIPAYKFAESVDRTKYTMSLLLNGKRPPSLWVAVRIQELTGGYVEPKDWLEIINDNECEVDGEKDAA